MPKKKPNKGNGEWVITSYGEDKNVTPEMRRLSNSVGWVAASHKADRRPETPSPNSSRSSTPHSHKHGSSAKNKQTKNLLGKQSNGKRGRPPLPSSQQKFKMVLEKDEDYYVDYESPEEYEEETTEKESEAEEAESLKFSDNESISSPGSPTFNAEFQYEDISDDEDMPTLDLPPSALDLLVPNENVMDALAVYEVLRHFRSTLRLSPVLFEDFCAAIADEEVNILATEVHVALLRVILKEEESSGTIYGPSDQKDAFNGTFHFIDYMTWPEVMRSYLESMPECKEAFEIVSKLKYPNVSIGEKIKVMQTLTNVFLASSKIRDELMSDGAIQYDDHCRDCHKLGDLLCCETCPAVYHLACCDPPLREVPEEEWQCEVCVAHKLTGVFDCEADMDTRAPYLRHDPIGVDRHGRKYWFIARRLIVEGEDKVVYYSTMEQVQHLRSRLDPDKYEMVLAEALIEVLEEFPRQSSITDELTTDANPTAKKTYLTALKQRVRNMIRKEKEEQQKLEEDKKKQEEEKKKQEEEKKKQDEERKKQEEEKKKQKEEEKKKQEDKGKKQNEEQKTQEEKSDNERVKSENEENKIETKKEDSENTKMDTTQPEDTKENINVKEVEDVNGHNKVSPMETSMDGNKTKTESSLLEDGKGKLKIEKDGEPNQQEKENKVKKENVPQVDDAKLTVVGQTTPKLAPKSVQPNIIPKVAQPIKPISSGTLLPSAGASGSPNQPIKLPGLQVLRLGAGIQVRNAGSNTGGSVLKTLFVLNKDGTRTQLTLGAPSGKVNHLTTKQLTSQRPLVLLNSNQIVQPKAKPGAIVRKMPALMPTQKIITASSKPEEPRPEPTPKPEEKPMTAEEEAKVLFRLGEDKAYKQYQNQYVENHLALNKYQHKEERDRDRFIGYKFSTSGAGEFKWIGDTLGKEETVIQTLRSTLLHFEHQLPQCFLHSRWEKYRNAWGKIVLKCELPQAFAAALGILEMAMRNNIKKSVWHDQLGQTRFMRVLNSEKDDLERRRKLRAKWEEDEANKNSVWCKYPIPVRSMQVWKTKGEEYRTTGYGGWLWLSSTYRARNRRATKKTFTYYECNKPKPGKVDEEMVTESKQDGTDTKTDNVGEVVNAAEDVIANCDVINVSENLLKRDKGVYCKKWAASRVDILLGWRLMQYNAGKKKSVENVNNETKPTGTGNHPVTVSADKTNPSVNKQSSCVISQSLPTVTQSSSVASQASPVASQASPVKTQMPQTDKSSMMEKKCNETGKGILIRIHQTGKNDPQSLDITNTVPNTTNVNLESTQGISNNNHEIKAKSKDENNGASDGVHKDVSNLIENILTVTESSLLNGDNKNVVEPETNKRLNGLEEKPVAKEHIKEDLQVNDPDIINETESKLDDSSMDVGQNVSISDAHVESESSMLETTNDTLEVSNVQSSDVSPDKTTKLKASVFHDDLISDKSDEPKKTIKLKDIKVIDPPVRKMCNGFQDSTKIGESISTISESMDCDETITTSNTGKTITTTVTTTTLIISKTVVIQTRAPQKDDVDVLSTIKNPISSVSTPTTTSRRRVGVTRMSKIRRELYKNNRTGGVTSVVMETQKVWKLKRFKKADASAEKEKRLALQLPLPWKFESKHRKKKNIFRLPPEHIRKLALQGGLLPTAVGFNYNTKTVALLDYFWPYPCPRPTFGMVWRYKLQNTKNLASVAHLIRVLWHCVRWDGITRKPPTDECIDTVTTEESVITTELLKRKEVGTSGLRMEYFIRRITVMIDEEDDIVRGHDVKGEMYTPSRRGLRSSTRPMNLRERTVKKPKGPQVETMWVPEDNIRLWQIRQFDTMLKQQQKAKSVSAAVCKINQSGMKIDQTIQRTALTAANRDTLPQFTAKIGNQQQVFSSTVDPKTFHIITSGLAKGQSAKVILQPQVSRAGIVQMRAQPMGSPTVRTPQQGGSTAQYVLQSGKIVKPVFVRQGGAASLAHSAKTVGQLTPSSQTSTIPTTPGKVPETPPQAAKKGISQTQIKLSQAQLSQLLKAGVGTPVKVNVTLSEGRQGVGQLQLIPSGLQVQPVPGQQLMQAKVGGEIRKFLFTHAVSNASDAESRMRNEVALQSAATLPQRLVQIQQQMQGSSKTKGGDMKRLLTDKDPLWGSRLNAPDTLRTSYAGQGYMPGSKAQMRRRLTSRAERAEYNRKNVAAMVLKSILDRIDRNEEVEQRKKKREEHLLKQKARREKNQSAKVRHKQKHMLHRYKESLKQDILKRRSIVERFLTMSAKNELHNDVRKQKRKSEATFVVAPAKKMKKSSGFVTSAAAAYLAETTSVQKKKSPQKKTQEKPPPPKETSAVPPKKRRMINTNEKLYCVCKTPYDSSKFYIGCDLCMNWFHGACVGIAESRAKQMEEWVCSDCRRVQSDPHQELYCVCRTPYDDSKFYIGCDVCQDWYHGACVGVTEAESNMIDSYVCPRCQEQRNKDEGNLTMDDYKMLANIIRTLKNHKMAWPFLKPVDSNAIPGYHKVIKTPMDLMTVSRNLDRGEYQRLSQLVSDVSLIFDNCRQFNGSDSSMAKCAEIVESAFVGKIREYRNRKARSKKR